MENGRFCVAYVSQFDLKQYFFSLQRRNERLTSVKIFLGVLSFGVIMHICAFPPREIWDEQLSIIAIVYSVSNLLSGTMVAYLYGVPYVPVYISWCGWFIAGCISWKRRGLYGWLQQSVAYIAIYYVGIKYLAVNSGTCTWSKTKLFIGIFLSIFLFLLIWIFVVMGLTHERKFNWTTIL